MNLIVNDLSRINLLSLLRSSLLQLGCETEDFSDELLFELWCLEDLGNVAVTYLAVRLKLLEFLMGRKFRSMDTTDGYGRYQTSAKAKSHQLRTAGSQGTEFSDTYDEEAGVTRSDEITKTKTTDRGITEANSCNEESHRSIGKDFGYGKGGHFTKADRNSANINKSNSHTEYDGFTRGGGNKVGCSFTRSEETTHGDGGSVHSSKQNSAQGSSVGGSSSYSISNSAWSKGLYDASNQSETSLKKGKGEKDVTNTAANYSEMTGQSGNHVQNHQHSHGQKAGGSSSDDYQAHAKRSWTYGYGSGETFSRADAWTDSGTKLKAKTVVRNESESTSDSSDIGNTYTSMSSQVFNNLKQAHEVTKANLLYLARQQDLSLGTTTHESSFIVTGKLPNYFGDAYARIHQTRAFSSIPCFRNSTQGVARNAC